MRLSDHFIDLVTEEDDPALRIGNLDALSVIRQRLGAMSRPNVALPGYLSRYDHSETTAGI